MAFTIPISLIRSHEEFADELINGVVATICKLVYPPKFDECKNCYRDPRTGRSSNVYKSGGPYPFTAGTLCLMCGGEGRLTTLQEETVRVRFYTNPKEWVSMEVRLSDPNGFAQLIGYMSDLPKFQRSTHIIVNAPNQDIQECKYEPYGAAIAYGFMHNRYFIQLYKRVV